MTKTGRFVFVTLIAASLTLWLVLPKNFPGEAASLTESGSVVLLPDTDGDVIDDKDDNCPTVGNSGQDDTDGDGYGDKCDLCWSVADDGQTPCPPPGDIDGDGVPDKEDNCPLVLNPKQEDADKDGIGDACDGVIRDTDADGIPDEKDNCPIDSNKGQEDADQDGIGDACDNCGRPNPAQNDFDGDRTGDDCDPPANANQCKKGVWQSFVFPRQFKNQGDCMQYFITGI